MSIVYEISYLSMTLLVDRVKRVRSIGAPLVVALMIQLLLLLLLTLVVVITPAKPEDPQPESVPIVTTGLIAAEVPPPSLHQELASAMQPAGYDRIQAAALGAFAMPQLAASESFTGAPQLDSARLMHGLESVLSEGLEGLGASDALSAGMDFSFLGLSERAERVVILFDISLSTVNDIKAAGSSIQVIQSETLELIDSLDSTVLFGLLQFARNHQWLGPEMQPATRRNRERARRWVEKEFRTDGVAGRGWSRGRPYNGIQAVLSEAFARDPEVIFIVSNGRFYRSPGNERVPWDALERDLRQLQRQQPQPVRIHFIGYGVRDEVRPHLRRLLRPWPGSLQLH